MKAGWPSSTLRKTPTPLPSWLINRVASLNAVLSAFPFGHQAGLVQTMASIARARSECFQGQRNEWSDTLDI